MAGPLVQTPCSAKQPLLGHALTNGRLVNRGRLRGFVLDGIDRLGATIRTRKFPLQRGIPIRIGGARLVSGRALFGDLVLRRRFQRFEIERATMNITAEWQTRSPRW